jgi:hypothetical protein
MPKKRIPSSCWALVLCLSAVAPAAAMGFGASSPAATLGQPLDFSVGLRLDPGESLEADCVRAEVSIGDVSLPAGGVGASLITDAAGNRSIRVRTLARIDEPVVSVQVAAGCPQRLVRRFVVFADPPVMAAPVVVAEAVPVDSLTPAPSTAPALAPEARVSPGGAAGSAGSSGVPPPARRVVRPRPAAPAPAVAPAAPRPRLKLDAAAPPVAAASAAPMPLPAPAMDVVEQANQAVLAAIAAASASQSRIAALEASVRQLGDDAAAQRALMETLRERAASAEGRNQWVLPLGLGVLALLALAGWLWLRLRELERDRRHGWLAAARTPAAPAPAPAAPPAVPPSPSQVPLLVERSVRTTGVASLGAGLAPVHVPTPSEFPDPPSTAPQDWGPETATLKTQPLVTSAALVQPESRDVSAEELIDLEQQAEFFVVLGQDDAAIDLLVSHLRDTGGASPLPYLKLLDIYRRLGDRDAYERTRDRFNHRFNAHVPGWDAPAGGGRLLEDYPHVMGWLQHVWPKPLDAMAELESLLFRKDGGELFELPAYRELLMLYALARDLLDGDAGGSVGTAVDVLLPLNDTPGFAPTSPRPYFGDEGTIPLEHQPTAPVDLDLDLPADPAPAPPYSRYR